MPQVQQSRNSLLNGMKRRSLNAPLLTRERGVRPATRLFNGLRGSSSDPAVWNERSSPF